MSDNWKEGKQYIYDNTISVRHGSSSFYKHLWKVHDILKEEMKQEDYLCRAGLFHSIYGTSYFKNFKDETLTREKVKSWIGEKAENLVYEFCVTEHRTKAFVKRTGSWNDDVYRDLLILEIANLRGQNIKKFPRTPSIRRRINRLRKTVDLLYERVDMIDKKEEKNNV